MLSLAGDHLCHYAVTCRRKVLGYRSLCASVLGTARDPTSYHVCLAHHDAVSMGYEDVTRQAGLVQNVIDRGRLSKESMLVDCTVEIAKCSLVL